MCVDTRYLGLRHRGRRDASARVELLHILYLEGVVVLYDLAKGSEVGAEGEVETRVRAQTWVRGAT